MSSAHCYFCGELTDGENMFQYDDTFIRVCENCQIAYGFVEDTDEPIEENKEEDKNGRIAINARN